MVEEDRSSTFDSSRPLVQSAPSVSVPTLIHALALRKITEAFSKKKRKNGTMTEQVAEFSCKEECDDDPIELRK